MTDTLYPVNAVGGAPANSGRMLRQAGSVALAGATAARPLGARSGVRPGTSTTTVTATSTTWTCGPFAGVADLEAAAEAGPYNFAFDAPTSGVMAPANASYARTDILYVQLDDPSESDGSAVPAVTRKYLAGQAVAGLPTPVPPVSRAMVIARINVPRSGAGSPSVTWVAPCAVAAGGILPVPSSAAYPASPYIGQVVDNAALGGIVRWSGIDWVSSGPSPWQSYTPTWSNLTLGNGSVTARYMVLGKTIFVDAMVIIGSSTTFGANFYPVMPFPISGSPTGPAMAYDDSASVWAAGILAANAYFIFGTTRASGSAPWTWAANDQIRFSITAELA